MPLAPGSSRDIISQNIKEMIAAGRPQRQAVAASLSNARRHPRAEGGLAPDNPPDSALTPKQEDDFQVDLRHAPGYREWFDSFKQRYGEEPDLSPTGDYDTRGAWLHGIKPEPYANDQGFPHWPSTTQDGTWLKKPNHPTHWMQDFMERSGGVDPLDVGVTTPEQGDRYLSAHQGSLVPHKGFGGSMINLPSADPAPPYFARQAMRELYHPGGLIRSPIAGRTDRIPMSVAANAYVLPADVVSGLGQGNTLSGARVLDHVFKSGPYGVGMPRGGGRGSLPRPPAPFHPNTTQAGFAVGGVPHGVDPVQIVAAGGEFIVDPQTVQHHPMLGRGDMKRGHTVLDHFVRHVREKTRTQLGKLPGPRRD